MIKSMTGFGQSSIDDGQLQISVEVKSLNSKFFDLGLKLPRKFSDREAEVRNLLSEKLERGKVSVSIDCIRAGAEEIKQTYNQPLFLAYFAALKKLADQVKISPANIFELALNAPEVIQNKLNEGSGDEEWSKVKRQLIVALDKCDEFRKSEGKALDVKLKEYCRSIAEHLAKTDDLDPKRVARIRERLKGNIVALLGEEGYDPNRLEQEIIFYIEKLDINEEKVRLKTHLDYFLQILTETQANGKKLGFIAQELGREINTIGSKANDAEIQKHVVVMKEELEKIKEQLNNVL